MKKWISLLLVLVFCITPLVSCDEDDTDTGIQTTADTSVNTEKDTETDAITETLSTDEGAESQEPETDQIESDISETKQPETDAPETDVPETNAPETDAPDTKEEQSTTTPEDETVYRLYIEQRNLQKILYLDGGVENGKLTTTDDFEKAIPVKFEPTKNGYKISAMINGEKKYIDVYSKETYFFSFRYANNSNCEFKSHKDTIYWLEKNNSGAISGSYSFGAFRTFDKIGFIPVCNCPPDHREPSFLVKCTTEPVEFSPEFEDGYKFKPYTMQMNLTKLLYLDGGIDKERFLTVTEDYSKAIYAKLEPAQDGYKIAVNINGAKKYIEVYINSEGKSAVRYADSTDCIYTYNSATSAWETTVDGDKYFLGTYSNFETIGASRTHYITQDNTGKTQFPLMFN